MFLDWTAHIWFDNA